MRVLEKTTKNSKWLNQQAHKELKPAPSVYQFPAQGRSDTGGAYYSEYFIQRTFNMIWISMKKKWKTMFLFKK